MAHVTQAKEEKTVETTNKSYEDKMCALFKKRKEARRNIFRGI